MKICGIIERHKHRHAELVSASIKTLKQVQGDTICEGLWNKQPRLNPQPIK